ncbi:MAG TPA: hypothetical protein VEH06_11815 [Candidatus Bathyarchaeia archaeon]|jgi:hypothetical protein|nr:hypothetical protein [Candidatus Bathyarchaeia archaeon]
MMTTLFGVRLVGGMMPNYGSKFYYKCKWLSLLFLYVLDDLVQELKALQHTLDNETWQKALEGHK